MQGDQETASTSQFLQTVKEKRWLIFYNFSRMQVGCLLNSFPRAHPLQRSETDFFSGEPLRALSTLVYSDNVDLQRSASLTFAEITERGMWTWETITSLADASGKMSEKSTEIPSNRYYSCCKTMILRCKEQLARHSATWQSIVGTPWSH